MNKQKYKIIFIAALISFLCMGSFVLRANADTGVNDDFDQTADALVDDIELAYPDVAQVSGGYYDVFHMLSERRVSIASKMDEDVNKAPSIVSVITAEEIEKMGFRTLVDALRIVPGFDIIKAAMFGFVNFSARGINTSTDLKNEKIRVMIDGHFLGLPAGSDNASWYFDDLPLKNVKRIEIIRGPGSALYGANAFLAVINIITKDSSDIDGIEVSSGFGSYDTQEYGIMYGKEYRGLNIAGFVDFYNTNGLSDTIKRDILSGQQFFNQFSLAPGDTDDGRKKFDVYLKASYKDLELNAKYLNKDSEPFVSHNFMLTNDSDQEMDFFMADLKYKIEIGDKTTIKPRLYFDQYYYELSPEFLPDGFIIPNDLDGDGDFERFVDGQEGIAKVMDRRAGGDIQVDFDLSENNTFTFGFNYEWQKQGEVRTYTNWDPQTGAVLDELQKNSDVAFVPEATRQIWALYLQDKWDLADNLGLTIGIRHDHYNDFEGTTNPRIGLVWNFIDNASLKLLYGQAFRAPSFVELFSNGPVTFGNSNLEPETIRTYEVELGYKVFKDIKITANYFFNVIRDLIIESSFTPQIELATFGNQSGANVQGVEFEVKADFSGLLAGAYAFANYTYQDAESRGDPLPDVPKHKGNVGINAGITKYLNANLHAFISGSRIREEADTRDDSPGYALLNLTLIAKNFFKDMKITASLNNLLDKNYNDPTPINTIPTDLPRPGRTFFVELGYSF